MVSAKAGKLLPVHIALVTVGIIDLVTTLFWLQTGRAVEFNPIMATVMKAGLPVFTLAKLATLAVYVVVMEWYRRNRSVMLARMVGNLTICAYLAIYSTSFLIVNHSFLLG